MSNFYVFVLVLWCVHCWAIDDLEGFVLPKIELAPKRETKGEFNKRFKELVNPLLSRTTSIAHEQSFAKLFPQSSQQLEQVPSGDNGDSRQLLASVGDLGVYAAAGTGANGYSGDNAAATLATLGSPQGIAMDSSYNLFIADYAKNVIRRVDGTTGIITTFAGTGTGGYDYDSVDATIAKLNAPYNVAADVNGDIYIADTLNHRIRLVSASTGIIITVAGSGNLGYSGDYDTATKANLYQPAGVAVDTNLNIYIADTYNHVIRVATLGGIIYSIIGSGAAGYGGDNGPGQNSQLAYPCSLWLDASSNLFIADLGNSAIRKYFYSSQTILTVAGNGTTFFSGDGGQATSATLSAPFGVAVDNSGYIFIADSGNNRIRVVDAATDIITTYIGTGATGDNGDHINSQLANINSPRGLAFDADENIYFADAGHHKVRYAAVVSPTGQPTSQPSNEPTSVPSRVPSSQPTMQPSSQPTTKPSRQPTSQPTRQPTGQPSRQPTCQPTGQPTRQPTGQPSRQPTRQPTAQPSAQPITQPTSQPSGKPTGQPSRQPSCQPSGVPSAQPTGVPTSAPTYHKENWGETVSDYVKRVRRSGLCHRNCSGHGECTLNSNCLCHVGLTGEPEWTGADCSLRMCPYGTAWVGSVMNANDMHPFVECSNKGNCDREFGVCLCFAGYEGVACQRSVCPHGCNARGICLPERILADRQGHIYSKPWDAMKASGCLCDKGYRGPSCEQRECPTGPDPLGGFGAESGRDCSGRGICSYDSGKCSCFPGFTGTKCEQRMMFTN